MSLRFSKSVTFHDYNGEENEEEETGQLNAQLAVVDTAINRILKRSSYGSKSSGTLPLCMYVSFMSFYY